MGLSESQGSKLFGLRCAIDLLEICNGGEQEGFALAELQRVYSGFTEGFDFPVMKSARKILESRRAAT